jgi:hypothetical protein
MNDRVDSRDEPALLARGFVEYWLARHGDIMRKPAPHDVSLDGFMAGAICVLNYFLGDPAPDEAETTEILALLAAETGRHMARMLGDDD